MGKVLASLLFGVIAGTVGAQGSFPDKPLRLVEGFPTGTSVDLRARTIGDGLRAELKQPIIIDNRPGADGLIGTKLVADSPANGYTLALSTNGTHAANMVLYKNPGYDAVKSFAHVGLIGTSPWVLATRPDFPARSVADLIAYGRANPGKLTMGHYSASARLSNFLLRTGGKFEILEVSYKGPAQMMPDLANGQLQAFFLTSEQGFAQEKTGLIRILGVTSAKRQNVAPDVPTLGETIPGFEMYSWQGIAAPAGTPKDVMLKLQSAFHAATSNPEIRERLIKLGGVPVTETSEEIAMRINAEIVIWRNWSKVSGVVPE